MQVANLELFFYVLSSRLFLTKSDDLFLGLVTRLRNPPTSGSTPPTVGLGHGNLYYFVMNIASLKGQDMILNGRDDAKDGWKSRDCLAKHPLANFIF